MENNRPGFELSTQLRNVRALASVLLLATVILQALGLSWFDSDAGFVVSTVLVVVVVAITAYEFVKMGRRRTPSRW